MRRGDAVTIATGSGLGSKPRSALIVQSSQLGARDTIVVLGFTTDCSQPADWRPNVEPDERNSLRERSALMSDTPLLVPAAKVGTKLGCLAPTDLQRADEALLYVFGLV